MRKFPEIFQLRTVKLERVCLRAGAVVVRQCRQVLQMCAMGVAMQYMGMNEQQVVEKLTNTDLRETCQYV